MACFAAFLAACGGQAERPNVLLVVIDTLRADHVGAYGYPRPTTPTLDRLASEGVVFERAYAPSSWTKPSVGSLFTSRNPSEHGATSFQEHLQDGLPTLAETLREAGYRTLGVSGNFVHVSRLTGMARGFERWASPSVKSDPDRDDAFWSQTGPGGEQAAVRALTAPEVNRAVSRLLGARDDRPLFLYVHYMEPHSGYAPPEALRDRFMRAPESHAAGPRASSSYITSLAAGRVRADAGERERLIDLYDAEIAAADSGLRALLERLRAEGYGKSLVVAVVSDHGEAFGEHDSWFHGIQLHAESLSVPVILWDSRGSPVRQRRDLPIDLLDVPTTLLAVAGVPAADGMRGRDLLATEPGTRVLLAELHPDAPFEERVRRRDQRIAVVRWPWKLIQTQSGERSWYRLDRDPSESEPLAEGPPDLLERVAAELAKRTASPKRVAPLETDQEEALRSLGYAE